MKRHLSYFLILLGVGVWVFALGFMYIQSKHGESPDNIAPMVGHTAPDFELNNLAGQSVKLGDLRGHPVLINFWATWCEYCLEEMPVIEKYSQQYAPELIVLGVDVGDSLDQIISVVNKYGFTYNILWDPDSRVFKNYRLDSFPVTFLLDNQGTVKVKHIGYMSESNLVAYLRQVGLER